MKHHTTQAQHRQLTDAEINRAIGDSALVCWIIAACFALGYWLAR